MKKHKRSVAAIVLSAVLATLYCSYSIDTEDWTVRSQRLPRAFDGFRITLLTDLHGAMFADDHSRLLEAVAEAKPDLIALSGDIADEQTRVETLDSLLRGLCAIAPTCYVTGNHEWGREDTEQVLERFSDCGVTVLRNDFFTLEKDGETLVIAGAEDPHGPEGQQTPEELMDRIRRQLGDPYTVMLYHRNNSMDLWAPLQPDLVLAGHGHGGVIRLPFVGGLLGVDRQFFPKDCEGLYTEGRTTLAVSRGLGGMRLWNRPHLPTAVLRTDGAAEP